MAPVTAFFSALLRLAPHALFGMTVSAMLHRALHQTWRPTAATAEEWILHAFLIACGTTFAHFAGVFKEIGTRLSALERNLDDLNQTVRNDERIIIARTEPLAERAEIAVIGVEPIRSGQIPPPLEKPAAGQQWAITISLLRFDRFQDLLFSPDYLRHFLTINDATTKQYRILIVSDKPRAGSRAGILSFLQMSQSLGIDTYTSRKTEFYEMCNRLTIHPQKGPLKRKAARVREIMEGQPELSLMRADPARQDPPQVTATDKYKLRFRTTTIEVVEPTDVKTPADYVDHVYWLLHSAIHDPDRHGLGGFANAIEKSCVNQWSETRMLSLWSR